MAYSICSIDYRRMKIFQLELFGAGVKSGYYNPQAPFTTPVMPKAQLEALLFDYNKTYQLYRNGGKSQKGDFLIAKHALIKALDEIADDVNEVAQGDEGIIMIGGYKPTKTSRSEKTIPPVPKIETVKHGGEGEVHAQCNMLGAEIYYSCLLTEGAPLPDNFQMQSGKLTIPASGLGMAIQIDETKSRKKTFRNLKPGTRYYVYFFARNSAGVSLLSDVRTIICG